MTKTLLCLGFGYTARALAPQLLQAGWKVIGTTRSADDAVPVHGVELITWPGAPLSLDGVTHILSSVGPTAEGDPVLNELADALAEAAQGDTLEWVGYLSTTAVYGDHDGAWVDEDTAVTPSSQRGRWRAAAETGWQAIPDLPLHIFRLAGIYGPGRGPFAKLMAGKARRIVKLRKTAARTAPKKMDLEKSGTEKRRAAATEGRKSARQKVIDKRRSMEM